jgi:hypothetical protein
MRCICRSHPDKSVWLSLPLDKDAANIMVSIYGAFHAAVSIYQFQMTFEGLIKKFDMNIVQGVCCHSTKIMEPYDLKFTLHSSC